MMNYLIKQKYFILSFCVFVLLSTHCLAGGQLNRMQQQKAMQQQAAQQMAYQQAIAQRKAQMQAQMQRRQQETYAQAVMQRKAQLAVQQRQMQIAVAQRQAQQLAMQKAVAERQAYQQAVAQRQVAEVVQYKQAQQIKSEVDQRRRDIMNSQVQSYANQVAKRKTELAMVQGVAAQQAKVAQQMAQHVAYQNAANQVAAVKVAQRQAVEVAQFQATQKAAAAAKAYNQAQMEQYAQKIDDNIPEEIVSVDDLWESLDNSGAAWTLIQDTEIKALTVAHYIDQFKNQGVAIKKTPGFYAQMIDQMSQQDPNMLFSPFPNVIQILAIMEYDFDNGHDKDALAKKVLGDFYFDNLKRIGR